MSFKYDLELSIPCDLAISSFGYALGILSEEIVKIDDTEDMILGGNRRDAELFLRADFKSLCEFGRLRYVIDNQIPDKDGWYLEFKGKRIYSKGA